MVVKEVGALLGMEKVMLTNFFGKEKKPRIPADRMILGFFFVLVYVCV